MYKFRIYRRIRRRPQMSDFKDVFMVIIEFLFPASSHFSFHFKSVNSLKMISAAMVKNGVGNKLESPLHRSLSQRQLV